MIKEIPKICICTPAHPSNKHTFNSIKDAIKYLKSIEVTIKVGDIVKVINTGKSYNNISDKDFKHFYTNNTLSTEDMIEIMNNLGHFTYNGLFEDNKIPDLRYEVIAIYGNKLIIKSLHAKVYYVIGEGGIEKDD